MLFAVWQCGQTHFSTLVLVGVAKDLLGARRGALGAAETGEVEDAFGSEAT